MDRRKSRGKSKKADLEINKITKILLTTILIKADPQLCYTLQIISKEQVLAELKKILDPELNINIVDLGLIYDLDIVQETGKVTVTMTLTTPGCPLSFVFEEWVPEAVKKVMGVKDVKINLVWEPAWDPDKISDEAKENLGIIK